MKIKTHLNIWSLSYISCTVKEKTALLWWPWYVAKAPMVCLVCAQVIHHTRSSVVPGTHLSPLLSLNLEAARTLHCAGSILKPSGYHLTAVTAICSELNINCGIVKDQYVHIWVLTYTLTILFRCLQAIM